MSRFGVLLVVVTLLCCLITGAVSADRLILTPTGTTLTTGQVKAEYAARTDGNTNAYWANVGISRVELEYAGFQNFGPNDANSVSAQLSILPETSFTPAVSLGARDIADDTDGQGMLYDGQSFYLAASKGIPVTGGIPFLLEDVKVHGGLGTGGLGGVFFGAEGRIPLGIGLAVEYDTEDFNFAADYHIIPMLKLRVSSMKGDWYYGAAFSLGL